MTRGGAGGDTLRVVVAPDSLKSTLDAHRAAEALADGWRRARPRDELVLLPQADGGEGTAEVVAGAAPGATWHDAGRVEGPDGRAVPARYLRLPDGTAVVDLATTSGIALMARLDPLGARTTGLGQLLRRATQDGAARIVLGLGGSASTDGGLGALVALGLGARDEREEPVRPGGGALRTLACVDRSTLVPPPPEGVELLVDVTAPLLGPRGAAAVFGPQKGAGPAEVAELEAGLAALAALLGGDPDAPGSGAAGGTAYGLAAAWGARIAPGALRVAELSGLVGALATADVLVTGEGRFDETSLTGKVVGTALQLSGRVPRRFVVAGQVALGADRLPPGVETVSLADVAGSVERSMADPEAALRVAAGEMARRL